MNIKDFKEEWFMDNDHVTEITEEILMEFAMPDNYTDVDIRNIIKGFLENDSFDFIALGV